MDAATEERFHGLESKIAYVDKDVAELNTTVFRQQQLIEKLESQLKKVREQLVSLGIEGDTSRDQPPPHY